MGRATGLEKFSARLMVLKQRTTVPALMSPPHMGIGWEQLGACVASA